jgi:hypothetical protein
MSFFKKIGKSVSSTFKKAPTVVSSIFKKTGDVSKGISQGLGVVSDVLGKVGSVANNPLVQAAASSFLGPEAGQGLSEIGQTIRQTKKGLQTGSKLADTVSSFSKGKIMSGIQKARSMNDGVAGPTYV